MYMLFLLAILMVGPPMISLLLYERLKSQSYSNLKRLALLLVFSFFINMGVYAAMWLRGWEYHSWTLDGTSSMTHISFVVKYMALSLVFAIVIPFVASLVSAKSRIKHDSKGDD